MTLFSLAPMRKMPCSYPGCTKEGLLNHEMCAGHRRDANRKNSKHMRWKRLVKKVQLGLGL